MNAPIDKEINTTDTGDETQSLTGDVNSDSSSLNTPVTSEELARQIKAATDPLTKQSDRLCDLMRGPPGPSET